MDFAANHKVKIKENGKKDKYLNLARQLWKLWNMKETEIPIVIVVLGMVTKRFKKGLEELIWQIPNDNNIIPVRRPGVVVKNNKKEKLLRTQKTSGWKSKKTEREVTTWTLPEN